MRGTDLSNINQNGAMPRSFRLSLILLGLFIIGCALAVMMYIYWPAETQNLQATLAPTLFISP